MPAPDPDVASPPVEERAHLDRLVAAVVAVAAGGSLPETLRHIVDAACDLVGRAMARWA